LAADGPINVTQFDTFLRRRDETRSQAIELLVLSACQTAAGDNRATLGLAGAAVRAGARSTLASLWNIGDRSTAILIGEFYRELANQVTKAEALRRAQVTLLKQYPNYSRPSYWAAFVLIGNWL
jgi:CHAT domain-containing protein